MISLFLQGKEGVRNMHLMEEPAFSKHWKKRTEHRKKASQKQQHYAKQGLI